MLGAVAKHKLAGSHSFVLSARQDNSFKSKVFSQSPASMHQQSTTDSGLRHKRDYCRLTRRNTAMLRNCQTRVYLAGLHSRAAAKKKLTKIPVHKRLRIAERKQPNRRPRIVHCADVSDSPRVLKLSAAELEVAIQDRRVPIIIDFYATWCGPCLLMAAELKKVAEELEDEVKIIKVDRDENPELCTQLRIEGLPTLMFLSTDTKKQALRLEGMIPAETVIQIVKEEL